MTHDAHIQTAFRAAFEFGKATANEERLALRRTITSPSCFSRPSNNLYLNGGGIDGLIADAVELVKAKTGNNTSAMARSLKVSRNWIYKQRRKAATAMLFLLPMLAMAELIPADRLYVGWTNAGVIGGIPDSSTMTVYSTITSTGDATDRTSTINTAIANCPSNQVVVLGAGSFRVNGLIDFINSKGVVLRGTLSNGTNNTTIVSYYTSNAPKIRIGNGSADWPWDTDGWLFTSDGNKGDTVLNLVNTASFTVGNFCRVAADDYMSGSNVVFSVNGYTSFDSGLNYRTNRSQIFHSRVTAKNASTITIEDPLPFTVPVSRNAQARQVNESMARMSGMEDINLDVSNTAEGNGINMWSSYNCWLKGVRVYNSPKYNVYQLFTMHCTIKRCNLDSIQNDGNNGAGHLMERSSLNLIEDSVITNAFPLIQWNYGSSGNVLAYNILENSPERQAINGNHGAHNSFNLYEGNVAADLNPEGFFGSVSHDTALRNRLHGINGDRTAAAGGEAFPIQLGRMTRFYNIVGNVLGGTNASWTYAKTGSGGGAGSDGPVIYSLGYPNLGNRDYNGTAELSSSDNWLHIDGILPTLRGYTTNSGLHIYLTNGTAAMTAVTIMDNPVEATFSVIWTVNDAYKATTGNDGDKTFYLDSVLGGVANTDGTPVIVWPGRGGYQERDLDVLNTLIRKGNYNYADNAVPAGESLGGDTIPDSYYLAGKPTWFGDLTWPPFNPLAPSGNVTNYYTAIPAGYRYIYGVEVGDAPAAGATNIITTPTMTVGTLNIGI